MTRPAQQMWLSQSSTVFHLQSQHSKDTTSGLLQNCSRKLRQTQWSRSSFNQSDPDVVFTKLMLT
jgi:hypothetical protein